MAHTAGGGPGPDPGAGGATAQVCPAKGALAEPLEAWKCCIFTSDLKLFKKIIFPHLIKKKKDVYLFTFTREMANLSIVTSHSWKQKV